MSERDVVYKIKLANDDGNAAILKRFGDLHTATLAAMAKMSADFGLKQTRTEEERLAKEEKARAAAAAREQKRREKEAADNIRLIERQAAESEKADQRLVRSHEQAQSKLMAGRRQLTEGLLSTQEAVTRLGRGFTLLGVVGEKDMAKLVAELAKVQAIIDITSGAARLYVGLTKAVEGYGAAVKAATAAETALSIARARSAAAGGVGPLNQGASGVASLAASGGAGAAAGPGAVALAAAAALAAVTAVLVELKEVADGTAGKVGSMTDTIASYEVKAAAWLHNATGGYAFGSTDAGSRDADIQGYARSGKRVESQQKMIERQAAERSRAARSAAIDRMEAYGADLGDESEFASGNKGNRLGSMYARNDKRLGTARGLAAGGDTTALGDVASFAEKGAALLTQRLNLEREITREKMQQAKEGIRGAEEELKLVDEKLQRQRESLLTAKERFGQLDPMEQAKLVALKQKADTSGFGALTREERAALRGVDTEGTTKIARAGDLAAAEAGGFDKVFGAEERAKISELEGQKLKVGVELTDKRALVVQLEKSDAELVQSVGEQVRALVAERDAALEKKFQAEVTRLRNELAALSNQQVNNRGALFGN